VKVNHPGESLRAKRTICDIRSYTLATDLDTVHKHRFAVHAPGLASGLALAVRPAGAAEAPALKGGSWRSFLRSG
jgi:hypothetical protein